MLCEKYLFEDQEEILAVPPNNVALIINSHGSDIYGRILLPALASESERAPVAVMLHGYPGLEQNFSGPDDPDYCVLRFETERYNLLIDWQSVRGNIR